MFIYKNSYKIILLFTITFSSLIYTLPTKAENYGVMDPKSLLETGKWPFTDVPDKESDWRHSPIKWGILNNIITGYVNGKFGPNDTLTEEQSITMLTKLLSKNEFNQETTGSWSEPYYQFMLTKGVNNLEYDAPQERTRKITRGKLAIILSKVLVNQELNEMNAIDWMFINHLTQGKSAFGSNEERYKPNEYLTRAEAVAFFQRVNSQIENIEPLSKELIEFKTIKELEPFKSAIINNNYGVGGYIYIVDDMSDMVAYNSDNFVQFHGAYYEKEQKVVIDFFFWKDNKQLGIDVLKAYGIEYTEKVANLIQSTIKNNETHILSNNISINNDLSLNGFTLVIENYDK